MRLKIPLFRQDIREKHIKYLCKQLDIKTKRCKYPLDAQVHYTIWKNSTGTSRVRAVITIPKIVSDSAYISALHEIGHVVLFPIYEHLRGHISEDGELALDDDTLLCEELEVWTWAFKNSLVPITGSLKDFVIYAFMGHIRACMERRELASKVENVLKGQS